MKKNIYTLVTILLMGPPIASSHGQEEARTGTNAPVISIHELVAEALEKNPELNFYRAEIAAAKGNLKGASTWTNPEVGAEIGRKKARANSGEPASDGTVWSVSVSQTFEFPGRISLRKAIANRDLQLAELGFSQFQAALASRVRNLGYRLLACQEKAEAARDVAERAGELRQTLVQREPAGVSPVLESRILEATVLTLRRRAIEGERDLQTAMFELNQLRGEPVGAKVTVKSSNIRFDILPPGDVLIEAALLHNFELQMRQAELEQQGFRVSLVRNERFPSLTLSPFYEEEKAAEKESTYGFGVSLPLPLWNRNQGEIQVAKARRIQADTALHLAQLEVKRQVLDAALTFEMCCRELDFWKADAVDRFREASELGDRHYRLGSVPITTYLELQEKYLEAIEVLFETRLEALASAQSIEVLTGLKISPYHLEILENQHAP